MAARTVYRTCPLCEATCGLEITVDGDQVKRIRGDRDDVFSAGFICPKGSTLKQLRADPDRLRAPLVRRDGEWQQATWDEAFDEIARRLPPLLTEHGPQSVGAYLGNPTVHNMGAQLYIRPMLKALGTRNIFSAATVDQMPKHLSSGLMFGHADSIPVPDIDRTDYLLMLGADPHESNGSLATAPDWPGRMEAIIERGGRIVVVDPRRSKTAEHASEHLAIRPGSDALFLAAVAATILAEDRSAPGRLLEMSAGIDRLGPALAPFTPEAVEQPTRIPAETTRRIAAELTDAPTAVVYGRVGTHTASFGTLASWLVDVINVLTGNLDRPGGAMFPKAATEVRRRRPFRTGRWVSRVRGMPEVRSELPVVTMADEILEEGEERIRVMITVAGNPVLSTPDSAKLEKALGSLDFMVSIDPYLNETTRFADVILPPPDSLEKSHYDLAFTQLSVRNVANYSAAVFDRPEAMPDEWELLLRIAAVAMGQGADIDLDAIDTWGLSGTIQREVADPVSPIHGRDPDEILEALGPRRGPERLLDYLIRVGPHGDGFGARPDGLTLTRLEEAPHGVDLGPLQPRLPDLLCTESGLIELAPDLILDDLPRLQESLNAADNGSLLLVGRRHLRSNNSWMHNVDVLVRGKERCTLLMHPEDADRLGIADGDRAEVASDVGSATATVEVSDTMAPGAVSLPHGWGHDRPDTRLQVAARSPGVNSNVLSATTSFDPLSGNAVLNAIEVSVTPAG